MFVILFEWQNLIQSKERLDFFCQFEYRILLALKKGQEQVTQLSL